MPSSASAKGEVILIAPPGVAASLLKSGLFDMQYFTSVDAFEKWRDGKTTRRPNAPLGERVDQALRELGIELKDASLSLRLALEWLRSQENVPHLKSLAVAASSRRSFFRRWAEITELRPSEFLDHLRGLYAEDLLVNGTKLREVLLRTGCATPGTLRRYLEGRQEGVRNAR